MAAEELARDREHAGPILATGFRPASRMVADLHPERSGRLVEIGPILGRSNGSAWALPDSLLNEKIIRVDPGAVHSTCV